MRRATNRGLLLAILATTLAAGCATTGSTSQSVQLYEGPKLEQSQVSVIRPWASNSVFSTTKIHSYLVSIDGKALSGMRSVDVMPGPHTVEAGFEYDEGGKTGGWRCPHALAFNTKAGQECEVKVELAGHAGDKERILFFWAEDMATKEVLSGTKPTR